MKFNDKFYTTPLPKLLSLVLNQLKNDEVFGIRKELFFVPKKTDRFKSEIYGQKLHTPIGVAAGPHSQLAQNIIAAWLTGARFIELKTVQTLDEIEVSKPCIDMQDEGYNCEWSQELKIEQSFDEYLNAWLIIHILTHKFDFPETGTIFNMSVGYDYKGIMNENVQWFLQKMNNCETELQNKIKKIETIYPKISEINIPNQISNNVTLSTMHGCPPDEIETIGKYLISERKLHTTIKLNPTLLGKEKIKTIFEKSGFKTQIPDLAYEHDPKFPEAVKIVKSLKNIAKENKVFFGIKTTNTLESLNHKNIFSEDNEMMYMSGKALHAISINVANKLQNEFDGQLNISFSGGADAFNISEILETGIFPVTVCTDLLKPGGYGRLNQYISQMRLSKLSDTFKVSDSSKLNKYAEKVLADKYYKREGFSEISIKTNRELNTFDCISAPCVDTCPTNQNIPQYMYFTSTGEYKKSFQTIIETNPLPTITGVICDHSCQYKCTRINYDNSLLIRDIKRFVAKENTYDFENLDEIRELKELNNKNIKIAIIGAGPAGLSAAFYLNIHGYEVAIYEEKQNAGGMVSNAIPLFRIEDKDIEIDTKRIEKLGVKIIYNQKITTEKFDELRLQNKYIFIATGAQSSLTINIKGIDTNGVIDPLQFFFKTRKDTNLDVGKNVVIIGGGNTAMDAARIARRLVGENGSVKIIYRRTKEQMPALSGEIIATIEENIEIMELVSPKEIISENGKVKTIICEKMKLGKKDSSGRPRPVKIENSEFEIPVDTIIPAVGQEIDIDFIDNEMLHAENIYTKYENIFIGGDALHGAASAIKAIADGRKVAETIISNNKKLPQSKQNKNISLKELKLKRAKRIFSQMPEELDLDKRNNFKLVSTTLSEKSAQIEAARCLYCDELCNICVTVCPNLANQQYEIEPVAYDMQKIVLQNGEYNIVNDKKYSVTQKYQVYNIADWCNECGNCNTICPTKDAPYINKPKLHLSQQSFLDSPHGYFITAKTNSTKIIFYKKARVIYKLVETENYYLYAIKGVTVKFNKADFSIIDFEIINNAKEIDFKVAFEMSILNKI